MGVLQTRGWFAEAIMNGRMNEGSQTLRFEIYRWDEGCSAYDKRKKTKKILLKCERSAGSQINESVLEGEGEEEVEDWP